MSPRSARALAALSMIAACMGARTAGAKRVVPLAPRTSASTSVRDPTPYRTHVELDPGRLELGRRTVYRGWLLLPRDEPARWIPPKSEGAFTWGRPVARRIHAPAGETPGVMQALDTVEVEIPLQIFSLGAVSVPGVRVWLPYVMPLHRESIRPLPTVRALVGPVLTPADSAAQLRPLRGPLAAPWWERVSWRIVAGVALGIAALIALIVWLGRIRKHAARRDATTLRERNPSAEALAELAALRRLQLPEHGRFAEHAFHLTRILRRYLEATAELVRPGDTTAELVARLAGMAAGSGAPARWNAAAEVSRLEGLLQLWDRIKFARGACTLEEARRAERAVEEWVKDPPEPLRQEVA
ncbi:MAG: hypothetical protein HYR73_00850 [Candidatus Eisenbacteria bacterium]|nr:hypothetical protein [Candidatus Eisenbacteria bacterium]